MATPSTLGNFVAYANAQAAAKHAATVKTKKAPPTVGPSGSTADPYADSPWLAQKTPEQVMADANKLWDSRSAPTAYALPDASRITAQADQMAKQRLAPYLGTLNDNYDQQRKGITSALTDYTQAFTNRVAGVPDAIKAAYDSAKQTQSAINTEGSNQLAALGKSLQGSIGGDIKFAGGTGAFSDPLATLGTGAGKIQQSVGNANVSNLNMMGAGEQALAAQLPAYAEGYGKYLLSGNLSQVEQARSQALAAAQATGADMSTQAFNSLYGAAQDRSKARVDNARTDKTNFINLYGGMADNQTKAAIAALGYQVKGQQIDATASNAAGYYVSKNGEYMPGPDGNPVVYTGSKKGTPEGVMATATKDAVAFATGLHTGAAGGLTDSKLRKPLAPPEAYDRMVAWWESKLGSVEATPQQIDSAARKSLVASGYTQFTKTIPQLQKEQKQLDFNTVVENPRVTKALKDTADHMMKNKVKFAEAVDATATQLQSTSLTPDQLVQMHIRSRADLKKYIAKVFTDAGYKP